MRSAVAIPLLALLLSCNDLSSFSTSSDELYAGNIVQAEEVRKGFPETAEMQLELNISDIDENPGTMYVSGVEEDGDTVTFFDAAALRPISSLKYDSLSSLDFPTGRLKNYIFIAEVSGGLYAGLDAVTVVSLMSDGKVEVRVFSGEDMLYGIFPLMKEKQ